MALQLRRGINSQRATTPLAPGELVYVTDNLSAQVSPLYIGDGSTTGGVPVVRVVSVNSQTGAVVLTSDNISEGTTNRYYLAERAQDDVAAALVNGVHTGITFTYNTTPQDSGNRIDAVVSASGTVNSGLANSLARYATTGTAVSNTENLTWDETSNLLTIENGALGMTASTSPRALIALNTSVNTSTANSIAFNKSRGTVLSPTTIVSQDSLGSVIFQGYDGDQFILASQITSSAFKTVSNNIVPSSINIFTMGTDGVLRNNLRVLDTGMTVIGPYISATDTGTGQLLITSTVNPQTSFFGNSVIGINSFFSGQDGQNFSVQRGRGTYAVPTTVQNGDDLFDISFSGYDGTTSVGSVLMTASVDGAVSTNVVPGAFTISVRNASGTLTPVAKINNSTSTTNGVLAVTGTVNASVAIKTGVFADNTARDTAIPTPSVGMIIFNTTTGKFEGNTDGTLGGWVALN